MSDPGKDNPEEIHSIQIGGKLKERLDRLRETSAQSYDELLTRLLDQEDAMRTLQTLVCLSSLLFLFPFSCFTCSVTFLSCSLCVLFNSVLSSHV
jgi:hypothetical protein